MITYTYGAANTSHKTGEFCKKVIFPSYYSFFYFLTPFTYHTENGFLNGNTGDILINSPGTTVHHGPTAEMTEGFRNDWFYAGGEQIDKLLVDYPLPLNKSFPISSPEIIKKTLLVIQSELVSKIPGYEKKIDLAVQSMLIDIYRARVDNNKSSQEQKMMYAQSMMRKHFDKNWTLAELAKITGYSVSRFSDLYRQKFNTSPISDLLSIRLESSQRLLLYTSLSIEEIAGKCGFGSIYHFSKFFKNETGISPTEFRLNPSNIVTETEKRVFQ